MKRLAVNEHTRIERGRNLMSCSPEGTYLHEHLYDRLRKFDCKGTDRVFDWLDGHTRTTQWVGVIQLPGLQIEILPKTDTPDRDKRNSHAADVQYEARRNLLYMLSVSGDVPVRSRDLARLAVKKAPLSDTLAHLFAERLRKELLRGPERAYQEQEKNLRCFKGKLLVASQTLHNAAHRERFYCRFDEFLDDTVMNRIFRASCRLLLEITQTPSTQAVLKQCLLLLDNVTDTTIHDADFDRISINRQNERFEDILRFSRLLLSGRTPKVQSGGNLSFSLLFDMNKVFERFISAFLIRHVAPRIKGLKVLPHAGRHKRHLMESNGKKVLRLEPDILVDGPGTQRLVIDTKWKLLIAGSRGQSGVSEADLYQLYAYTRRYGCKRSILLYPYTSGLKPLDYNVLDADDHRQEKIAIRQVNLHRNLQQEAQRVALANELEVIVREGIGIMFQKEDKYGMEIRGSNVMTSPLYPKHREKSNAQV